MPTLNQHLRLLLRAAKYRCLKDNPEMGRFLARVPRDGCVIDIGAHKGAYTFWLSRRVGTAGKVYAFEPQNALADELRGHFGGCGHVEIHENALSDVAGDATLFRPLGANSPAASLNAASVGETGVPVEVKAATLDEFIEAKGSPKVHAIKCDVEGHELAVFRGGRRVLERDHPVLYFECEGRFHEGSSGGTPMAAVFDFLRSLGYDGYFLDWGRRRSINEFDPAKHQTRGKKPYVNNFFFEKK